MGLLAGTVTRPLSYCCWVPRMKGYNEGMLRVTASCAVDLSRHKLLERRFVADDQVEPFSSTMFFFSSLRDKGRIAGDTNGIQQADRTASSWRISPNKEKRAFSRLLETL